MIGTPFLSLTNRNTKRW